MDLFIFITVIVGMSFIFLYFVIKYDLKRKELELEEKRIDLEKRKLELSKEVQEKNKTIKSPPS